MRARLRRPRRADSRLEVFGAAPLPFEAAVPVTEVAMRFATLSPSHCSQRRDSEEGAGKLVTLPSQARGTGIGPSRQTRPYTRSGDSLARAASTVNKSTVRAFWPSTSSTTTTSQGGCPLRRHRPRFPRRAPSPSAGGTGHPLETHSEEAGPNPAPKPKRAPARPAAQSSDPPREGATGSSCACA